MVGLGRVGRERWVGAAWGALFTGILAILIVVGSRNLQHFDAALVGYTFAVLFATFAIRLAKSRVVCMPRGRVCSTLPQ